MRTTSGARKMVKDKKDGGTISFEEYGYDLRTSMDVLDVDWNIPSEFPDLRHCSQIAVDLETRDPNIKRTRSRVGEKRG